MLVEDKGVGLRSRLSWIRTSLGLVNSAIKSWRMEVLVKINITNADQLAMKDTFIRASH